MNRNEVMAMAPDTEPARQKYFMDLVKVKIREWSEEKGRPLTCFISTFGCQMNARDSEKLLGILQEIGFVQGEDEKCTLVEGYIRTSESDELVSIKEGVYSFFILPKDKMIILHGENCEEYEFLGYKSENTKGCFMIIHAVTE